MSYRLIKKVILVLQIYWYIISKLALDKTKAVPTISKQVVFFQ